MVSESACRRFQIVGRNGDGGRRIDLGSACLTPIRSTALARAFARAAESDLGDGVVLFEAVGDEIVRQVEVYGSSMIWCDRNGQSDDRFMLADQPLSSLRLTPADEISLSEFEGAWAKARVAER